jgi:arsenical pump membrane protein
VRPRKIPEWVAALIGAALMVALGIESAGDAWRAAAAQWNVLLFFAGLMTIIAVAESAQIFVWIAHLSARAARGSARRLFLMVIIACAAITMLLTNDAAALVMTPLVFSLASQLRLRPLPYAFACAFMANAASLLLPISNPVNVVIAEAAHLTLDRYVATLWLAALVAAVSTAALLTILFARRIRRAFDPSTLEPPPGDPAYRAEVAMLLVVTGVALTASTLVGGLVGVVACAAAAVLLTHGLLRRRIELRRVASDVNPSIIILVAALFSLAEGVIKAGSLAPAFQSLSALPPKVAGVAAALAAAIAANLFNNLPTAALAGTALSHAAWPALLAHRIAAGAIVGCDLGPNLTIVGSLSTLLWLILLRRRGLEVSSLAYARIGVVAAPVALLGAIVGLMVTSR